MDVETGTSEPVAPTSSAAAEAPVAARDPLGAGRALLLYALYFAAQIAAGVAIVVVAGVLAIADKASLEDTLTPEVLMAAAVLGVVCGAWLVLRVAARWSPVEAGGLPALDIGWSAGTRRQLALAGAAGVLLGCVYIASLGWLMSRWRGSVPGPTLTAATHSRTSLWVWSALALLVAPPIEELLFRGLMLRGLSRSWGPFAAGLTVTALFVAGHVFETGTFVPGLMAIAALGCATLAARAVTGALGPAIALHAGYNFALVLGVTLAMR